MEDVRIVKRVGNYSTAQAEPEDCKVCGDAKYATVLIDDTCLDCLLEGRGQNLMQPIIMQGVDSEAGKGQQDRVGLFCARKEIAKTLEFWLDNNEKNLAGLIDDNTQVFPVHYPSRGTLKSWIKVLVDG